MGKASEKETAGETGKQASKQEGFNAHDSYELVETE